ncbi:Proteasome subunit beta type-1 [Frankliniella fusca]|uniref:Proteasome subunit beta type-1 n=1 Tax=Frankliniella fusca TaxID=407009 RepID=A0AAE1GYM8_9NEOP|nr:Proteasome subunit beta type-1 [Frankliniella fusca]
MAMIEPFAGHTPVQAQRFSPYSDNGGTIVAIAGEDFAVIGSDTRLTVGYSINTREQSKLFRLSDKTVLGSCGCWCDVLTLTRVLNARLQMYNHEHQKEMNTPAVAQLLSTMLYYKRFFPYYVSNLLAGLDADGKGAVYHYDPVGHYERNQYYAGGSSSALLQPFLDNQVGMKNMNGAVPEAITRERAVAIVKDAFISAAEREIHTGDAIIINIIDKTGVKEERFSLRKD